jgi:hypothetical protein
MDEIVNSVYGIASTGLNYPQTLTRADTALQKLSLWKADLPLSLQVQGEIEAGERASLVLHMIYNQVSFFFFTFSGFSQLTQNSAHNPLYPALPLSSSQAISRSKIPSDVPAPPDLERLPRRNLCCCCS